MFKTNSIVTSCVGKEPLFFNVMYGYLHNENKYIASGFSTQTGITDLPNREQEC